MNLIFITTLLFTVYLITEALTVVNILKLVMTEIINEKTITQLNIKRKERNK